MPNPTATHPPGERLQRVLADAGVASRRACEALIESGSVEVNGQVVRRLPVFVDPARDRIRVNGRPLQPAENSRRVYVMLHKPPRVITSSRDEPGLDRRTVLDLVKHPGAARLFAVGRLDFAATGLVLLTNDGELAHRITHPRYGLPKTYRVTVRSGLSEADIPQLEEAISRPPRAGAEEGPRGRRRTPETDGAAWEPAPQRGDRTGPKPAPQGRASPASLRIEQRDEDKTIFLVTLQEGPNRHLRDVLKRLGMPVRRMERTAVGPLRLSGLAPGQWRELTREEVKTLKRAAAAPPDSRGRDAEENSAPRRQRPSRGSEPTGNARGSSADRRPAPAHRVEPDPQTSRHRPRTIRPPRKGGPPAP